MQSYWWAPTFSRNDEEGGSMFLQNVGVHQEDHMVLKIRVYITPWK
jgi:hypothetical protein